MPDPQTTLKPREIARQLTPAQRRTLREWHPVWGIESRTVHTAHRLHEAGLTVHPARRSAITLLGSQVRAVGEDEDG